MNNRLAGLLFIVGSVLCIAIGLWNWEGERHVYCPLSTLLHYRIAIYAYLKLDANHTPECIEIRRTDYSEAFWFRSETVLCRAFGFEFVQMSSNADSVILRFYVDSADTFASQRIVVQDVDTIPYFEIR